MVHATTLYLSHLAGLLPRISANIVKQRIPSLLNLIGYRYVLFEDAFGEIQPIDIDVISEWTAVHYRLTCAFKDKPGYRRVAVAGYCLCDRTKSGHLIDPKDPPPFASVFQPKIYVQISIHFEWSEVSVSGCPSCGLKQARESG
jgi:hypothetical protein